MRVLAIDTAGPTLGLALVEDGKVILSRDDATGLHHTDNLLPRIDAIISDARWTARIDGVSVASGPGSFTGLRIGVATAKAIAFASGASLVFVDTLDGLAYSEEVTSGRALVYDDSIGGAATAESVEDGGAFDAIVPVLDARKGRFYTALFLPSGITTTAEAQATGKEKAPQRVFLRDIEDRDISLETLKILLEPTATAVFPGSDAAQVAEALGYQDRTTIRGSGVIGVGILGYHKIVSGATADPYDGPFYLREVDIGQRKKGPRFSLCCKQL